MMDVPCNGCTLCCRGDAVRLLPGDDVSSYITEPHHLHGAYGARMLAHKPDGDCIYLAPWGCTIHARRPRMCREMDCRVIALKYPQGRPGLPPEVLARGTELLRETKKP